MKLTRDSALWTITLLASVAVFFGGHFDLLTKAFPSLGAVWQARIELVAAVAGFLAGYLKMSPLPLNQDSDMAVSDKTAANTLGPLGGIKAAWLLPILLVAGLGFSLSACATAGSFDQQAERLVHDSIVQSEQLHAAHAITDEQFKAVNVKLHQVSVDGRDFTALLAAKKATPADAQAFLASVATVAKDLNASLGAKAQAIVDSINQLEAKVTALLGKL